MVILVGANASRETWESVYIRVAACKPCNNLLGSSDSHSLASSPSNSMETDSSSQPPRINFIFYYGTTYFKNSGVTRPFVISLIANIVNVIATVPGLYLVERAGRAPLLFIGALGMGFCQLIIAVVGLTTVTEVANRVLIALTCIYIAFFAMTWGLGGWIVTGEIFPLRVRAKSMSMTAATNWIVNWALVSNI